MTAKAAKKPAIPLEAILRPAGSIFVPPVMQWMDPYEYLRAHPWIRFEKNFKKYVEPALRPVRMAPGVELKRFVLREDADDAFISIVLPEPHLATWHCIDAFAHQCRTDPQNSLMHDCAHILYMKGVGEKKFAVSVHWLQVNSIMHVYAWPTDDRVRWQGNRTNIYYPA